MIRSHAAEKFRSDYAELVQKASGLFLQEFGYALRDPFEEIVSRLRAREDFAFSRFGDGEFNAIFLADGANCDGHRYFPELGRRLRQILDRPPSYLLGLQPLAILIHGARRIRATFEGPHWTFADCFHLALIEGRINDFFGALAGRDVALVGAPHHRYLAEGKSWEFIEVPYGDCWPQYRSLLAALKSRATTVEEVFLLCASMTANVLVDDLHQLNPRNTYIDAGSIFDPYVGVNSRSYHEHLDLTANG
jgi:hypothetical protein